MFTSIEFESQVTNADVADAILREDVVGRNQTVDRYGSIGHVRELLRYKLRRLAGLGHEEAKELSKQGLSDISEEDVLTARKILLDMIESGETIENVGFIGGDKNMMRRVIADTHGYNQGTTITA